MEWQTLIIGYRQIKETEMLSKYKFFAKASMTSDIFKNYLIHCDLEPKRAKKKLYLVDYCPVQLIFKSTICQPLDFIFYPPTPHQFFSLLIEVS